MYALIINLFVVAYLFHEVSLENINRNLEIAGLL